MSYIHTYHQYDPMKHADKRFGVMMTAIGVAFGATAGTATATAIGVGVTGLAAYGAYKGFQSMTKKDPLPQLPGQAKLKEEEPSYDRAAELAKKETDARRRGIARNKPNYTSARGLTQVEQSNMNLKTLTGA